MQKGMFILAKKIIPLIVCLILFTGFLRSNANEIPEYIRVALKYETTAVPSVTTSSETGGTIGIVLDGAYTPYISFTDSVTVLNDSLYHIQIGDVYNTYEEAIAGIDVLMQHAGEAFNLKLFPVYNGSWVICSSNYTSEPILGVNLSENGIDEFKILYETFAVSELIDTPEGKEPGPSFNVVPFASSPYSLKVAINSVPLLIVSHPNNSVSVRVLPNPGDITRTKPPLLKYGKAEYRGSFDMHRQSGKAGDNIVLVNRLLLEEYLYSVVPSEISPGLDNTYNQRIEALKVQALSARSFAVRFIQAYAYSKYRADIEDSTTTQVYGGYTKKAGDAGEYNNSTIAVNLTKGQVLLYNGKIAPQIYYHSHSGGYTEVTENVWGGKSEPYLVSRPDPYTTRTYKVWSGTYTGKSISSTFSSYILNSYGVNIGLIKYINVINRSASGRITETLIEGSNSTFLVTKERNRWMLSLNSSSQLYTYNVQDKITILSQSNKSDKQFSEKAKKILEGGYFTRQFINDTYALIGKDGYTYERLKIYDSDKQTLSVNGKGTGHGVGMSQVGVIEMSKDGVKAEDIIQFYFPGLVISPKQ